MKRKRALKSIEDTLWRQEKNRTHMASMRGSETQEQTLEGLEQNRTRMEAMANARTRTVPVEGAVAAFHFEVKLGPCTSVLE